MFVFAAGIDVGALHALGSVEAARQQATEGAVYLSFYFFAADDSVSCAFTLSPMACMQWNTPQAGACITRSAPRPAIMPGMPVLGMGLCPFL